MEVEGTSLPSVVGVASPTRQRTLSEGSVVRLEDISRPPSRVSTHSRCGEVCLHLDLSLCMQCMQYASLLFQLNLGQQM